MSVIDLEHTASEWAQVYEQMWDMAESFHGSLALQEIAPLADLLTLAGRPDLAAIMLREWAIIELDGGDLDDGRRIYLGDLVRDLPAIPDHRNEGDFDWSPYITPEESDHESGI